MRDGYQRIGWWFSGIAHLALILWLILGGILFSPQPPQSVQITEISTISGAEFEAFAAASRGAGPVERETASPAAIIAPEIEPAATGTPPPPTSTPIAAGAAQELAKPDQPEAEPDLSNVQNRPPVDIVTNLPVLGDSTRNEGTTPDAPSTTTLPTTGAQPNRPEAPPQDQVAETLAPRSPLALDDSVLPPRRPEGLVERYNERLAELAAERAATAALEEAERLAAEQAEQERLEAEQAAAAEAERLAAEQAAQRELEELAERERQEAEQAAAEARAAEQLAADQAARAEAERQAEEERRAEAERERIAREEEERLAEEEKAAEREAEERAEQQRLAAEQAAAAAQEVAERQAIEGALQEAQNAPATGGGEASATDVAGQNRQRIEGGTGASVEQDPLAAALAEALSGQGAEQAPPPLPPNVNQFLPRPITPRPLSENSQPPAEQSASSASLVPPLSISEREGFRVALARCWNRGALSVEAAQLTVSVKFLLGPDGRPDPGSLELNESQPGSAAAIENAFGVARRAILECGQAGFPLPREKYGRWQRVIVDFHPEGINF